MKNHFKGIVVHDISAEEKDFRSLILKIKNQSPSLICLFILPGQVSNFAKQMKELGVQIQIMGTDIFDSEKEIKDSNGGLNGSFFANIAVPTSFKTKYEKFKEATQIAFAYNAYESMMLIFEQFAQIQNKQIDGTQILSKLKQSSKNIFTYAEDSSGDKRYEFPLVIKKIVDGKIEG